MELFVGGLAVEELEVDHRVAAVEAGRLTGRLSMIIPRYYGLTITNTMAECRSGRKCIAAK